MPDRLEGLDEAHGRALVAGWVGPGAMAAFAQAEEALTLDERFFYRIAIKNGLISAENGEQALRAHDEMRRKGAPKPLQEILLDIGLLEPHDVDSIHDAQAASQVLRLDSLYANIALRLGHAKRDALDRAFVRQREERFKIRVGEVLLEWGLITSEQHRRVLSELLTSVPADEKEYMRQIRLRRRLAPGPLAKDLAELKRLRTAVTESGGPAPEGPGRPAAAGGASNGASSGAGAKPLPARTAPESTPVMGVSALVPPPRPAVPPTRPTGTRPRGPDPLTSPSVTELRVDSDDLGASAWPPSGSGSGSGSRDAASDQSRAASRGSDESNVLVLGSDSSSADSGRVASASGPSGSGAASGPELPPIGSSDSAAGERPGAGRPSAREADPGGVSAVEIASASGSGEEEPGASAVEVDFLASNWQTVSQVARKQSEPKAPSSDSQAGEARRPNRRLGGRAIRHGWESRRDGGGKGAKGPPRTKTATFAAYMESALEAAAEAPELGGGAAVREGDVAALETDLAEASAMVEQGLTSPRDLERPSSDGSRERAPAFSTKAYVDRRRRQRRVVRGAVAAVLILVVLPLAVAAVLARQNQQAVDAARVALAEGRLDDASAALAQGGAFWVGAARREELAQAIALRRALGPLYALKGAGRFLEAQDELQRLRAKSPQPAPELDRLDKELTYRIELDRGDRLAAAGDALGALQAFERARRADPAGDAGARVDALQGTLAAAVADAEQALARAAGDERAFERFAGAARRYQECFDDRREELDEKLTLAEHRRALALGDRARDARDYEQALVHYGRAAEAAERLALSEAAREAHGRQREATELLEFQRCFNQGQLCEQERRFADAIAAYKEAARWVSPDSTRAVLLRRRIEAAEAGRVEAERTALEASLWQEALEALRASRIEQAVRALEELTQTRPEDARAARALEFARGIDDMVYVPAGKAVIGAADPSVKAAGPPREETVPAFFMDRHEVRNRAYQGFLDREGGEAPEHWELPRTGSRGEGRTFPPELADHPVVNVSCAEAEAFARAAGKRLPTEVEWERAARGADGRIYPWGGGTEGVRANVGARISERIVIGTRPVGTSAGDQSPFGVYDLGGNVSEWTTSPWLPYPGQTADAADWSATQRVIRGGSWRYDWPYARAYHRDRSAPERRFPETGFRCVRDIPDALGELR